MTIPEAHGQAMVSVVTATIAVSLTPLALARDRTRPLPDDRGVRPPGGVKWPETSPIFWATGTNSQLIMLSSTAEEPTTISPSTGSSRPAGPAPHVATRRRPAPDRRAVRTRDGRARRVPSWPVQLTDGLRGQRPRATPHRPPGRRREPEEYVEHCQRGQADRLPHDLQPRAPARQRPFSPSPRSARDRGRSAPPSRPAPAGTELRGAEPRFCARGRWRSGDGRTPARKRRRRTSPSSSSPVTHGSNALVLDLVVLAAARPGQHVWGSSQIAFQVRKTLRPTLEPPEQPAIEARPPTRSVATTDRSVRVSACTQPVPGSRPSARCAIRERAPRPTGPRISTREDVAAAGAEAPGGAPDVSEPPRGAARSRQARCGARGSFSRRRRSPRPARRSRLPRALGQRRATAAVASVRRPARRRP